MGVLLRSLPCASGAQSHLGPTEEYTEHLSERSTQGQDGSMYLLAPKPLVERCLTSMLSIYA